MPSVKVGTRSQISIPGEARRRLGIRPGDRLTVTVHDDELILRRRSARASDRLRGIGKGMYGPDAVTFVRTLRDELEANLGEREAVVGGDAGGAQQDRDRLERPDLPDRGR